MRTSDVASLKVRAGAHNLQNSASEAGVQDVGVKLVVKHKDFTMETLVRIYRLILIFYLFWFHFSTLILPFWCSRVQSGTPTLLNQFVYLVVSKVMLVKRVPLLVGAC